MSLTGKTYNPLLSLTIKAQSDLPHSRFIGFDGNPCAEGAPALGVTEIAWNSGQYAQVIAVGTAVVEASGTIVAGDSITSDTNGTARKAVTDDAVNGRAINAAESGGFVTIKLLS